MGFVGWIGRALGPIVLEHSLPMLRDWWKTRLGQPKQGQQIEQLASDMEQLKTHAAQLATDLDLLNRGFTEREEKLRKWVLILLIWNIAISVSVALLAIFALRR